MQENQSQPATAPAQTVEQSEIMLQLRNELIKAQTEVISVKARSLSVYEENQMYKASPSLAAQMAEMQFQLKMATQFIASKAFKAANAEQAYVIIKAGAEMGMQPVEAMQALYCVNGAVKIYGDKMVARITKAGYKIEYLDESPQAVTVRVTNQAGFEAKETVSINDPIIQKSNAYKFAPRQKLRFHAVRMIASFHLPHLFGSTADEFSSDFQDEIEQTQKGIDLDSIENRKQKARILDHINKAKTIEQLEMVANVVGEYELVAEYNNKVETINRG